MPPLSLTNAAQFCNVDDFLFWDPVTDQFDPGAKGRSKRIDTFTSLWNASSRRHNIFFALGTDVSEVAVIQHVQGSSTLLLSQTSEHDSWAAGSVYNQMYRTHKVLPPSGGKGAFRAMVVLGTGDDLGAVTAAPDVVAYLDVERSGEKAQEETLGVVTESTKVVYSRNVFPLPGDFFYLDGHSYRVNNPFVDAGFRAAIASQIEPHYEPVTFHLQGVASPVFDPSTGTLTTGTSVDRIVSVQRDAMETVGRPTDRDLAEKQTLYIYNRHIGFSPTPGMQVTFDSRTFRVTRVDSNFEREQWKVEVEP